MTRDVLIRKLGHLRTYLGDLEPHRGKSPKQVLEERYEIERLLELVVQVAVDIVSHELAERGVVPETYRKTFFRAADEGLLPDELADPLADAAGLRNVLVHLYEDIDYEIVAASVDRALEVFGRLLAFYADRLDAEG